MTLLDVVDLRTQFHTREGTVRAVDGVSFRLNAGEALGLVGESGCGKSVTALSIMRLLPEPPTDFASGQIFLDGADVLAMSDEQVRRVRGPIAGMVFQDPMTSLNPVLTIGRQLMEPLRRHLGLSRSGAVSRATELLDLVGIPNAHQRLADYPHQFSGGMRQRVMIAMALSCNPKLLLADEITTALDATIQAQVLDLVRNLTREFETGLLLISHDLGLVAGMTQRVHVMYAGQIVEKATTKELFTNPKMPYTWGLLRSTPAIEHGEQTRLTPIDGLPPDPTSLPSGCRFEPRCKYSRAICRDLSPDLIHVRNAESTHEARCWGTQDVPGGGWLMTANWRDGHGYPAPGQQPQVVGEGTGATLRDRGRLLTSDAATSHSPLSLQVEGERRDLQLLQVSGLTVRFALGSGLLGKKIAINAVDNVGLEVFKGETLALVGESGSGKSTLGRAILQIYRPTKGSVKLSGTEITSLEGRGLRAMRRRMQMIFQDPYASLNPRMTIGDTVGEPLEIHKVATGPELGRRIADLLETVGLNPKFADRYPHEFSGGQRQRVGIARALALEPDLIVADEPISSLDVSIQAQILNLLTDLQDSLGLTYLFISHDLAVVHRMANRVAVMYLGKVVELAGRAAIFQRALHPYTQALLSAAPVLDPSIESRRKRIILEGEIPSPINPPSGCRFRTRCFLREELGNPEICAAVEPPLEEALPGHWSACHFAKPSPA